MLSMNFEQSQILLGLRFMNFDEVFYFSRMGLYFAKLYKNNFSCDY